MMTVTFEMATVFCVAVGMLWGCGFLLARPLLPWRLRPFTVLYAPFLGLGLVSSLAHYLGAAGLPLRRTAWLFVALAAAGWVSALSRRPRRPPREVRAVLGIALVACGIAVSPLVRAGYLTTVGTTSDALSYVTRAEYLQDAPLQLPELVPGFPSLALVHSQAFLRAGDVYLLGLLGLLSGHRAYQLLSLLAALFFALASGATFAWARGTLRMPRDAALGAAVLVALSNLLLWAVYGNFFSQAVAAALVLPMVGAGIEAGHRPGWRSVALCGLLAATLASVYPIYACFAAAFVALDWAIEWVARPRGWRSAARRLGWGLTAAVLAVAWNGVAVARTVPELRFVAQLAGPTSGVELVGRGDIRVCPSPGEIAGFSAHVGKVYGAPSFDLPKTLLFACGTLLCAFALYGWSRLAGRQRIAAAVVLLASAGLAAWQRWILDQPWCYAYGYFKTVSIVALGFLPLAAAGLAAGLRHRRWRWVAAPMAVLLVSLNLWQAGWTADYAFDHLLLDREAIAAACATEALSHGAWVWIDVARNLRQNWFAYLIRQPLIFREGLFVFSPGPVGPSTQASYGLIERGLNERERDEINEPWYNPTTSTPIWRGGRYELRRRTGRTLATLRWGSAIWPPSSSLEAMLGTGRGEPLEVRFAGTTRRVAPVPERPRSLQLFVFSAASAADLAVEGAGAPLSLAAGGYLLDLDLACLPGASSVTFRHRAGALFLRRWQMVVAEAPRRRGCLDVVPLPVGMGYVEQRMVGPREVEYEVTLLAPPGAGERTYRLGFHVVEQETAQLYGVWSFDFAPHTQLQQARIRLDLERRSAQASSGGLPLPGEVTSFTVDRGRFEADAVWWQFHPLKQILVDPVLWFSRFGRPLVVTRTAVGNRMTLLEAP